MKRVVVGISGATGFMFGVRILELVASDPSLESHLIVTSPANLTRSVETKYSLQDVLALADCVYRVSDVGAAPASGSFRVDAMLVAPCSARSMCAVAYGLGDNLLTRAADVTLKERRPLILLVRETPLHLGHLRAMCQLTEMGAVIMPPVPSFYQCPDSVDELIDHTARRALRLAGISIEVPEWRGMKG